MGIEEGEEAQIKGIKKFKKRTTENSPNLREEIVRRLYRSPNI
jgi:hypothetical protein